MGLYAIAIFMSVVFKVEMATVIIVLGAIVTAMSIFGKSWGHRISGQVLLHGKPIDVGTVEKAACWG